jgi:spore germination cell wall hydrolase CwlJ-like protein
MFSTEARREDCRRRNAWRQRRSTKPAETNAGKERSSSVVLNRVRRRGFPKTVCGVVYQGSSRRTGCQFTFTCDGSFERRRARAGWVQARKAARRALEGYVFADVGTATHYHTDWVVPYWSGSLAKIAQVETHIFYR